MESHRNSLSFNLLINGMLLVVSLFAISSLLTFVQRQYLPIVDYIDVQNVYHDDAYNHDISGVLKKSKFAPPWLCKFGGIDASMLTPSGWDRFSIEYYDQPEDASITRHEGESVFGNWKLKTFRYPDARTIKLNIKHKCFPMPLSEALGFEVYFMDALTTITLDLHKGLPEQSW